MKVNFLQLSTYTTPEVREVNNQDWIQYGADNNYFQFLIDRYNGSATNNALINGISQMIVGRYLDATDSSRKPNEYAQMKSMISEDMQMKLASDLKLMGQCAIQVIYSQDRLRIAQVEHVPIETLRAEKCNEEGEIPAYYYFYDWEEFQQGDELERIPVFGSSNSEMEILYIKPYRAGFKYYSPVDYQGGIQYAELEEEIANYHLNNIMNGLAPSMLINFNNGTPTEEERNIIEQKIAAKYQGTSNAGRYILAFNDSADSAATMEAVQLSDAPQQYEFLSTESMKKIMVAHRVTSPILFGIKDMTGFGNNAEEIVTASTLMDNTVIRPFQQLLLNAFDDILAYNKIVLNLYFKTLQPLEFNDLTNATNKEQIEEETGQKFSFSKVIDGKIAYETIEEAESKANEIGCMGYHEHELDGKIYYMPCQTHEELKAPCWKGYEQIGTKIKDGKEVPNCVPLNVNEELTKAILSELEGKGEDEEIEGYELIDSRPANDYDKILNHSLKFAMDLATVPTSTPNKKSSQDTSIIKVRYRYYGSNNPEREFCRKMWSAKKVYRMEDLDKESSDNPGFGPGGSNSYNLWLYKGGVNCQHYWERRTYLRKNNKRITVAEARRKIAALDPSLKKEAQIETNVPEVAQVAQPKNDWWSLDPNYRK
tara:strand:+ start:4078 stop:6036 length:1959 start_codon:yes stop_codon:yes gene_type:complete